ncbi:MULTISPECIES: hypothetical protein [unclassified Pseudomonas]|jgi:hypothetical protein|uniref:hypothetical protein n=1 Tax=unclassified Pseudomonas TaxID=196821 RepID=UPI001439FBF5|nr:MULTISPECIES: hypothetical protein [unclassified Pseudomonas]MCP1462292.1 hypothetical protein [Pseudomonas sp. S3E17]
MIKARCTGLGYFFCGVCIAASGWRGGYKRAGFEAASWPAALYGLFWPILLKKIGHGFIKARSYLALGVSLYRA